VSTIYKRATPSQARLLRIISGAVLNTNDAHPGKYKIDARFARGVAKRAVGTLTAQAGGLAVEIGRPSHMAAGECSNPSKAEGTIVNPDGERSAHFSSRTSRRAGDSLHSLALFKRSEESLARLVRHAKLSERHERAAALIDALTVMGRLRKSYEK
jgi:hypothetical protein